MNSENKLQLSIVHHHHILEYINVTKFFFKVVNLQRSLNDKNLSSEF